MTEPDTNSELEVSGGRTLLGAAAILFTLLILIAGLGVAIWSRLDLGLDFTSVDSRDEPRRVAPEGQLGPGQRERPLRTDGRRLSRTEARKLEWRREILLNEKAVAEENMRMARSAAERAEAIRQLAQIEEEIESIDTRLRTGR